MSIENPARKAFTDHPRAVWIVVAFGLCVYVFAFQGSRGLWEPDEGRYTNAAIQMLRRGDWMTPHLNDETTHLTKPPLTYWAIAVSMALFGKNEWAARLPCAIAFLFTVLLVYGLGQRLTPQKPWLAALIYASSPFPYAASNIVTTDTVLALWETLAVFCFVRLWMEPGLRRSDGWGALMWCAFGLAFLTKGPPGLLPLAPIIAFIALTKGKTGMRRLISLTGMAIFLAIAMGWHLALAARYPGLLQYFLRDQIVKHIFVGTHHSELFGGFVVYLPVLATGALPWAGLALWPLPSLADVRLSRRMMSALRAAPRELFLLLWLTIPLGVFFCVRSRLPLYILPLFVPLSLLLARRIEPLFSLTPRKCLLAASWIILLTSLKWGASVLPYGRDNRPLAQAIRDQTPVPPAEIAFVNLKPFYGLSLYCGVEVEHVSLDWPPKAKAFPEQQDTVPKELAEGECPLLFIVAEEDVAEFHRQIVGAGAPVRDLGSFGALRFMWVPHAGQDSIQKDET